MDPQSSTYFVSLETLSCNQLEILYQLVMRLTIDDTVEGRHRLATNNLLHLTDCFNLGY